MRQRIRIRVSGTVQGVGFRPFVHALASRLGLGGFVRNQSGEVLIEAEGEDHLLQQFQQELLSHPPPLARIDRVSCEQLPAVNEAGLCCEFAIEASQAIGTGGACLAADVATCPDCLAELRDPADRRSGYPFLNCTSCGPRLTITTAAPWDRSRTTMAAFPLCADCLREYSDPGDRRFHAQPVACPQCGPQLQLLGPAGEPVSCSDPLAELAGAILAGRIVAMKGLGGYHLVCDAGNEAAVRELRHRKQREEKPFAIMLRDVATARTLCEAGRLEQELLESGRSPIVLLRRIPAVQIQPEPADVPRIAEAVAPGNPWLGVLLPYTPLHHLLADAVDGTPLVMSSGNRTDEPIAIDETEAVSQLSGIADLFLVHNRPVHVRCDDSVTRVVAEEELPVRRSRGYAPQPIRLPVPCPVPLLATGGQLKGTFALGLGEQAIVSHHLGDLNQYRTIRAFERDVALYQQLCDIRPECIAHDLHPDYATTAYARRLTGSTSTGAGTAGIPLVAVQHHHAHMAACMAEHGLAEPVIGVTFDGTGYGTDGAVWGGEFLTGDLTAFRRVAHLRYVGLPGGGRAVREPWRMAVACLTDAGCGCESFRGRISPMQLASVQTMLKRGFNTPPTSSMGRLFDAVAALAGVRDLASYEGQAAMELEWLATGIEPQAGYPWETEETSQTPMQIDTRPLIRAVLSDVLAGVDRRLVARRFHSTIVDLISETCVRIRQLSGLNRVVLSGGVFLNAMLTAEASGRLQELGFETHRHRLVPPGDGGLSLGQLAVAAAVLKASGECVTSGDNGSILKQGHSVAGRRSTS